MISHVDDVQGLVAGTHEEGELLAMEVRQWCDEVLLVVPKPRIFDLMNLHPVLNYQYC